MICVIEEVFYERGELWITQMGLLLGKLIAQCVQTSVGLSIRKALREM